LNWLDLIQITLAPVVLITAVGLINISLYNRYGRIHDRIRHLLHDIDAVSSAQLQEETREKKIANAKRQIEMLFERAKLSKWSLFLMQFSLIGAIVDSLLIFVNVLESVRLEVVILVIFGFSVLLILISAVLTAVEISKSLKGLSVEVEAVTETKP